MFRDQVRLVALDGLFKECLFLITSNDNAAVYCLKFKLWNEPCPKMCDQYVPSEPGNIEEAKQANYDIECLDFTRKLVEGEPEFYCSLYNLTKPLCKECLFHRYAEDPSINKE
ncbi:MAG: hypothetical protein JSW11_05260 [Candidatus Heimdallarchaeota archaeon]|nr:MAG: hypothetical protein JSW11_05260 [Candidatus Heimdallarchaeota archaeon]